MSIDIIFLLLLVFAAIRGFQKGLIMSATSLIGFFIGLAAALKLSATIAHKMNPESPWIPFLAFLLVFFVTVWVVEALGRLIHESTHMLMAGIFNRIGGAIIYMAALLLSASFFLFYARTMGWVPEKTASSSIACQYLEPLTGKIMDGLGRWIPLFQGTFDQILQFFDDINGDLKAS